MTNANTLAQQPAEFNSNLASWNEERTPEQLHNFIQSRLRSLGEIAIEA